MALDKGFCSLLVAELAFILISLYQRLKSLAGSTELTLGGNGQGFQYRPRHWTNDGSFYKKEISTSSEERAKKLLLKRLFTSRKQSHEDVLGTSSVKIHEEPVRLKG